jgi:hypothetical protein
MVNLVEEAKYYHDVYIGSVTGILSGVVVYYLMSEKYLFGIIFAFLFLYGALYLKFHAENDSVEEYTTSKKSLWISVFFGILWIVIYENIPGNWINIYFLLTILAPMILDFKTLLVLCYTILVKIQRVVK